MPPRHSTPCMARLLACIASLILACTSNGLAAPPAVHSWKGISYPPLPVPGLESGSIMVHVGSGQSDEESQLRFEVGWSGARDAVLPGPLTDSTKLVMRLHLPDGKVVLPNAVKPMAWWGIESDTTIYSMHCEFPWQGNQMDEAWIEIALPGQTYWIELPYGFVRDPAAALPADTRRGKPVFPPTMKALGRTDKLVPWLEVFYDLGKVQNGWDLTLMLANPFDAQAELILYRDDWKVGESRFLWKLDTPKTLMEIKAQDGSVIAALGMAIRLHEDGLRRSDDFEFNRYPEEDGRDWGTVTVSVDDKSCACLVPSSMFKYVHGVTNHGDTRRLARPQP